MDSLAFADSGQLPRGDALRGEAAQGLRLHARHPRGLIRIQDQGRSALQDLDH